MICGTRGPAGYICTLPEGHIEAETFPIHLATVAGYQDGRRQGEQRCTCRDCVQSWLFNRDVLDEWDDNESTWSPTDGRRYDKPAFKNPPDVRTTKAARLP